MDKPLTTTGGMDETGMDELCSALAALNRHGLRITGRLDAMATLDRHGLRISGHFHAMDIIQVGLCIADLESRLAEVERERDEARDRATVLDFDREHARLRAIALDEICTALFGPGEYTVDEVRAAVPALVARATAAEARVRELEERIVALEAQLTTRGACRVCGCTDDLACEGSCYWVEPDLCSACAPGAERCPHAAPDENEQPTDDPCPFGRPCPFHDAREVRRG